MTTKARLQFCLSCIWTARESSDSFDDIKVSFSGASCIICYSFMEILFVFIFLSFFLCFLFFGFDIMNFELKLVWLYAFKIEKYILATFKIFDLIHWSPNDAKMLKNLDIIVLWEYHNQWGEQFHMIATFLKGGV